MLLADSEVELCERIGNWKAGIELEVKSLKTKLGKRK